MNEELGGYITKLIFNDGRELSLNKDDIVVFVGPNNSGKSQSLRDIFNNCQNDKRKGIVIKDILLSTSTNDLSELISKIAVLNKSNNIYYYFGHPFLDKSFSDKTRFGSYRDVFVSFLQTDERLSYCKPQENISPGDNVSHPMQFLIDSKEYRNKLSKLFNKAFQENLYCYSRGRTVSIRVGKIDDTISSNSRIEVADSVMDEIGQLPHIENQGDGMRSFVSILLSLCLDYKRIHLFDEPESFLHQAQARIVGRMIGEELKHNQQAFISTHSTDFIKGLLEKAESRVKVIRITRDGNTNHFHILDNNHIQEICNDEMLKHTNILEGLFSNKTIVCEGDVDCLLFSSIEEYLLNKEGNYSESSYLFTGGKSSFKKTLIALKGLGIDFRAVMDLDALNDENLIKSNYEVCGGNWQSDIKGNYDKLMLWIKNHSNGCLTKEEAKNIVCEAISKCKNDILSSNDIKNVRLSLKANAAWEELKHNGKSAINDVETEMAFDKILLSLKEKHIYLIPTGEIESFFPDIEGHGHGWLQNVFKDYPSFESDEYNNVKNFVKSLIL